MGDAAPSTGSQARQILQSLQLYAPDAIKAISGTLGGTAQAQLAAQQGVEPGYENLYNQNQLAAANTEANVAEGPGQRLVTAADTYQKQLDPEYYKQRVAINDALNKYLGSYSPTELTPTEIASISRGINATTGPITPSATNTIKNAQVFGEAGTNRWKNFGDAVTKAASVLPTLRSGISGFNVATGRGQDTGAANATNNALSSNFGFSTSALGDITGAANAALAKRKSTLDQIVQGTEAFKNVASGVGSIAGGFTGVGH